MNIKNKTCHFLLFLTIFLVLTVSGCLRNGQLKEVKIGISSNMYPFNYYDSLNVAVGFEIDMVNEFSKQYHLKPVFVQNTLPVLLKDLKDSKLDMIVSSVSENSRRSKIFTISDSYYDGNQVIVCNQDSILSIQNIEDASKYRVGIQTGSSGQYLVEKLLLESQKIKPEKLIKEKSLTGLISDLKNHKADLIFLDKSIAETIKKEKNLSICTEINTGEKFSVILPLETSYKSRVNRFIRKYKKSEQYQISLKQHFLRSLD